MNPDSSPPLQNPVHVYTGHRTLVGNWYPRPTYIYPIITPETPSLSITFGTLSACRSFETKDYWTFSLLVQDFLLLSCLHVRSRNALTVTTKAIHSREKQFAHGTKANRSRQKQLHSGQKHRKSKSTQKLPYLKIAIWHGADIPLSDDWLCSLVFFLYPYFSSWFSLYLKTVDFECIYRRVTTLWDQFASVRRFYSSRDVVEVFICRLKIS